MTRTASNSAAYLCLVMLLSASCAGGGGSVRVADPAAAEGAPWFAVPGGGGGALEITGRLRIELPRYRVRGACGLYWSGDGFLQVDFDHASLFGALREEATILIGDGRMEIHDGRRGTVVAGGDALALLGEQLGLEVFHDDLVYLLLLRPLPLGEGGAVEVESHGDEVTVRGTWRGRLVEIEGSPGMPPRRLRVASADGTAYETRYGYPRGAPGAYPERIVCERAGGGGRISLTVESAGTPRE